MGMFSWMFADSDVGKKRGNVMAIKKTVVNQDVSARNNNFEIQLVYIGEGYNGNYDENDPEDDPLIRVDLWDVEELDNYGDCIESTCTTIPATMEINEANELAKKILMRIKKKDLNKRKVLDVLLDAITEAWET